MNDYLPIRFIAIDVDLVVFIFNIIIFITRSYKYYHRKSVYMYE